MKTATASKPLTAEERKAKQIHSAWKKHLDTLKSNETPMTLDQFTVQYAEQMAKEAAADQVSLSEEVKAYLEARECKIELHTPENGSFAGIEGPYVVNNKINVERTGFMRLSKERIENTLERMKRAEIILSVVAGKISVDEALLLEEKAGF